MSNMLVAKDFISQIKSYKPGKSKTDNSGEVIKLSSNENALGASKKAVQAYRDDSKFLPRYPDGGANALRSAIAKKYNLESDNIVCGAGSDEIIAFLTQAFAGVGDEVIYSQYGFLMYPISTKKVGATPIVADEVGLVANIDNIIAKITDKTKIIFIANPNNPTGSYLDKSQVDRLIDEVPKNVMIVLDLAYAEFVSKQDYPDVIKLVQENPNVVMTRTFSKIHGLASLRIGWSYSSKYVANILNQVRGPFNVSSAAQAAAVAAIEDQEFLTKSRQHNDKWLKKFQDKFKEFGIKTYPSIANFILIDFETVENCQKVNQLLLNQNIILREMGAYGLPNCLRMTIGTEDENLRVIQCFSLFSQR